MGQIIYIDVLICINLFVNYFVLLSLTKFLSIVVVRKRLILAALVGAFFSLIILLPDINGALSFIVKVFMSLVIVIIAYGFYDLKFFIKSIVCFYLINFIFAGIMFFIWYFLSPKGLFLKNGIVYFNLSPIFLIISTVIIYLLIKISNFFLGKKGSFNTFCKVKINYDKKSVELTAKIDTGNSLREVFSNTPVIVAKYSEVKAILPEKTRDIFLAFFSKKEFFLNQQESLKDLKIRLVPFETISGKGVLLAFKPESVEVSKNKKPIKKEAYVGVCKDKSLAREISALVGEELLE